MPVSDEYAARTACRDHTLITTIPLRGSLRGSFYSRCERKRMHHGGCKYSHTIFNTDRVHKLGSRGGLKSYVVSLHYGHGFERYGAYEGSASGWDVEVAPGSSPSVTIGEPRTRNLPKALLAEEARAGLKKAGDAFPAHVKTQSLCEAHHARNACQRPDCKFDHNLVDSDRIEKLARWTPGYYDTYAALTVECRVVDGRATWKIILKEPVFATLKPTDPIARRIPSKPYSYESAELLDVVKHMEQVVGITGTTA